jgi:type IV secretory pathway VirB10-like protein
VRNNSSFLGAADSPQSVQPAGVRRLNHIPLFIIGAVAAVVAVLLAFVAFDKSKPPAPKQEDHGGSADDYAAQVVGNKVGYVRAENVASPSSSPTPAAGTETTAATPPTNAEMDARHKAFFEALYAKSAISDPTVDQMSEQRQQAISAAQAAKVVQADPNNLGGSTPGDISDYERKMADTQRLLGVPGIPSASPNPNNLGTYDGSRDRWTLNTRLEAPTTPYILRTGWVIPALLLTAMESELPGKITAQVSEDVYDSGTGNYLLIPQGSRLVGEYANAIQYGQSRIFVAWQRIIYPDNSALDIGAMPGADGEGESGFHDLVDNHFLRLFGSALLMSAITAGITYSQEQGQNNNSNGNPPRAGDVLSVALGQQLGAATSALLEKNLSVPPTLKIRQGYGFNVVVVKDLVFDRPYVVSNY